MMNIKGRILQLQHYSVNDGDGIRTIVFFAGCPLHCRWCANPEGLQARNRIMYIASRCIGCGRCTAVCPLQIGCDLNAPGERDKCIGCGACVKACLEHARKNTVTDWTVQQVLDWLEKNLLFFRESGGGVTYSGGECTQQPEFLAALVRAVYDMGLNQAIETSGYFPLEKLQPTLDLLDLLFIDIKHMDRDKHRQFTGVDNGLILQNIAALGEQGKNIIIRVPAIMGVNGDEENIRNTARFVRQHLPNPKMELLPYHSYGADKYTQLGLPYEEDALRRPTEEELARLRQVIEAEGVETVSFR
ncbi:MAG: glycyl-radical enzyme activating protein [Acidaminococcaceae bacterium]|nr:glycyl-radical enzyme activating protein [Acidaminococcaceae bacterium]